jgi:hypothetical protein
MDQDRARRLPPHVPALVPPKANSLFILLSLYYIYSLTLTHLR